MPGGDYKQRVAPVTDERLQLLLMRNLTETIDFEDVAEAIAEWCASTAGQAAFRRITGVRAAFADWTRGGCGLLTMALVEMFPEGAALAFVAPDVQIRR